MAPDDAGELFVIGGAEDKLGRRTVLREFVESAGGADARIAVIPTASSLGPEIIDVYRAVFTKLGAAEVVGVRPETRADASDPAYIEPLDDSTGIFMTGGNQLKLSSVVAGTAFGEAILAAHRSGATVGGTSAGASIQSSHMVAFGAGGATPKQRMTQVAAGLGLFENCVIDQHFEQRNRYGRLLMIVAQNPQLLGIGVDEDTAAVVRRDGDSSVLRVVGRGAVTIFDPADLVTNAFEAKRSQPILASGVRLHVLPAGAAFDLTSRTLLQRSDPVPDVGEAHELALASQDLRRLTRDIAAEDKSPAVFRRRIARRQKGTSR
jgi:cyanophycinase